MHERLPAEARVHGHDEQQVDLVEVRLGRVERRLGVDGETHVEVQAAHLREQLTGAIDLDVHRTSVGARVRERLEVVARVVHHQMTIEVELGMRS